MADTKISAMPPATTLTGTEIGPLVQGGSNVQTTVTDLVSQTIQTAPSDFRDDLGLGTIAVQDADDVNITEGTIGVSHLQTLGLTGYLYGNNTSDVTASTTIPASAIDVAYGAFLQNGSTTLTNQISNNATTPITVGDTTEFGSSGYMIIEQEVIQYVGKSSTQLGTTSVTRGVKGTTNVSHDAGSAVTEAAAVASATSSQAIGFDTTIYSNDVSVVSTTQITFANAGLYNIQFSLQLLNYTSSEDNVTVWLRLNGTDVAQSASIQQVNSKHGSSPGASILALNLFQQVTAGQYVELYWASETGNTVLASFPAGTNPVHPVSPAVILTAIQVA